MNIEYVNENGVNIAVVSGEEVVLADVQSALDLAMTIKYSLVGVLAASSNTPLTHPNLKKPSE